jgi:hypothetical protein
MLIDEITNKHTLKAIGKSGIDVSKFENIQDLRKEMKRLNLKSYQQQNKEYFNSYMKKRYKENPEIYEQVKIKRGITGSRKVSVPAVVV